METVSFNLDYSMVLSNINLENKYLPFIATATTLLCTYMLLRDMDKNKNHSQTLLKEIPSPGSHYPFVGHLPGLGIMPDRIISRWHDDLGPILKFQVGVKNLVSVSEPKLAHKLLTTLGSKTSFRYQTNFLKVHYSLGEKGIAFAQPDGHWRKSRSAGLSLLSPRQIDKYQELVYQESNFLADNLIKATIENKDIGICPFEYLNLYVTNVAASIGFGKRFKSLSDREYKNYSRLIQTSVKLAGIGANFCDFFPCFSVIDYFTGRKSKMHQFITNERNPVFRQLIKEARYREGINMIKTLDENGYELSEDETIVLMSDFNIAGSDNVLVNIAWNMIFMCHHPEVQKNAIDEIDTFIKNNGRTPLFRDRLNLPYCVSVIKECMRCRPSLVFGLPREVHEDIDLDGYIIHKGSIIITNLYSMTRNSDFYHDPEVFYPERFIDNPRTMQASANGKVDNRDHFSFGWGRRTCPGTYLSEQEIFSTYVAILSRCFIEPSANGMPDIDTTDIKSLNNWPLPFNVKFVERPNSLVV